MSSMCVQRFTAFEVAVLKLHVCTLGGAITSNMAVISMEMNCEENSYLDLFSIFVILILLNTQ